jgi:hypothetical protein
VQAQPALAAQVEDLDLGYLPTSSAYALGQLLPVLAAAGKRTSIRLASQLDADVFKSSHVIYIGYISALGMMQDVVFAGSRFAVGASYDELIDVTSGASYVSQAGEPKRNAERYKDYAYVSTFPGPNGNQHLVVAGTRDTAVRQAAEMMVGQRRLDELRQQAKGQKAYEALYEVYGVNRTNIEARLLIAEKRLQGHSLRKRGHDRTVPRGDRVKPVPGHHAAGPDHVLNYHRGIAGYVFPHVADQHARINVKASAGFVPDDNIYSLALVEFSDGIGPCRLG